MDAERLSKNVSVQMTKTFPEVLQTNSAKRDAAQIIRQRPTLPIEYILPSIQIDENCFKTVDNHSMFRVIRFNSTEIQKIKFLPILLLFIYFKG